MTRTRLLSAVVALGLAAPLSASPLPAPTGSEFQVNAHTTGSQTHPALAKDGNGNFVIVWQSVGTDGSGYAVMGRLFDANGSPTTGEFQVNTFTTNDQRSPAVAVDGLGNFIVAWESFGQDGSANTVEARLFDSTGAPLSAEFQVNTYTTGQQQKPSIGADLTGNFVVAWESFGQDGDGFGVFGRRFDSGGNPLTAEFQVNDHTTAGQGKPAVAQDSAGTFTVVWHGDVDDGSNYGIFGRRFNGNGTPIAASFQVNTYTTGNQTNPSISGDVFGNFLVVWQDEGQDGDYFGVFGRFFDINGAPLDVTEFAVNTYTIGAQERPAVTTAAGNSFVVSWQSYAQDGSYAGVFSRPYDNTGQPASAEFQVNTYTRGFQGYATVGSDDQGRFVVAWQSDYEDGSGPGIFARRFGAAPPCAAGDADGDHACDDTDNCPGVYNPGQQNGDADGRGDACDIILTNPLDGGIIDCSDPVNIKPTITWSAGFYDRFRVTISWSAGFAKGTTITSGSTLLKTASYIPPTKKLRKACTSALAANPGIPVLFIQVYGKDVNAASSDPDRTTFSDVVQVSAD